MNFDFTRLCDRTESVPALEALSVWRVVASFRTHCLSKYAGGPDGDIDPASPASRSHLDPIDELVWYYTEDSGSSVRSAIARLLRTPRLLKQALRRTWQAWQVLHGEIDFDDLLAANVLRAGAPRAYDFLLTHLTKLRELGAAGELGRQDEDQKRQPLLMSLSAALGVASSQDSARLLVFFLFPQLNGRTGRDRRERPQGVSVGTPTDYWERLNVELVHADLPDQAVLRLLRDAKCGRTPWVDLARRMQEDEPFAAKFEQFTSQQLTPDVDLSVNELLGVASLLFEGTLQQHGAGARASHAAGYFPLWRATMAKASATGIDPQWLHNELIRAGATSMSYAADMLYYWGNKRGGVSGTDVRTELRNGVVGELVSGFEREPSRLCSVLTHQDPGCLYRLLFPEEAFAPHQDLLARVGTVLLDAASNCFTLILPHLGLMLSKKQKARGEVIRGGDGRPTLAPVRFQIDEQMLDALFPSLERREMALRLLAADDVSSPEDGETARLLRDVRTDAQKMVGEDGSGDQQAVHT